MASFIFVRVTSVIESQSHLRHGKHFGCTLNNVSISLAVDTASLDVENADVPCKEVCVCCHKVLIMVRQYHRHTKAHLNASETKASYMAKTRDELRTLADETLLLEEARRLLAIETTKKRSREVDGPGLESSGGIMPKANRVEDHTSNIAGFGHALLPIGNAATPVSPSMLPAAPFIPTNDGAQSMLASGIENMSGGVGVYADSLGGVTPAVDEFGAYIHQVINFPESWRIGYVSSSGVDYS